MVTLSPGRILMKCIRIFPEMCASTRCPFSSSTRNMAFGSVSMTLPSTSIGSSFAICSLRSADPAQDDRPVFRNGHGVLEMGRQFPVGCHHRPAVAEDLHPVGSLVDHGLDREDHPRLEFDPPSAR